LGFGFAWGGVGVFVWGLLLGGGLGGFGGWFDYKPVMLLNPGLT